MFVRATVALVGIALLGCITIILAEEYAMNIHNDKRASVVVNVIASLIMEKASSLLLYLPTGKLKGV